MTPLPDTAETETRFIHAVQGMLARPDYLIPIAAAERQFRDHYYGLNSAALLEDLFFDALGNFLRQTEPKTPLMRPPTGQKGWDYAFDGLQISHKVSQNLTEIAALWDATKRGVTTWSFDDPIVYVLGTNTPSTSLQVDIDAATSLEFDDPIVYVLGNGHAFYEPPGRHRRGDVPGMPGRRRSRQAVSR